MFYKKSIQSFIVEMLEDAGRTDSTMADLKKIGGKQWNLIKKKRYGKNIQWEVLTKQRRNDAFVGNYLNIF